MQKRLECKIKGRVQMVMFRDFVCRNARKLGVAGSVQNISDGSVCVVAEGEEEKLKELLNLIYKGSILSKVEEVEDTWIKTKGDFTGFNIIY
jgi:acylphosphatase